MFINSFSFVSRVNKKGSKFIWVSLSLLIILIVILFLYFALFKPGNGKLYEEQSESRKLINPVSGLSLEEGINEFDEGYIEYLFYELKAYELHNPPLSKDTPRIELDVDSEKYNVLISNGLIKVYFGEIDDEDIMIKTSKEEIVKSLQDKEYIKESFSSGKSEFELVANKATLFSKGYLSLYKDLTGKGITGSVIGIYLG